LLEGTCMLRRALGVHLVGLCLLLLPLRASALDWYTDRAAWQSAVGIWADVDLSSYNPYDVISAGTPIPLPYDETLALDLDVEVRQVPTSWIADWTGDPKVLCSPWYSGAITGTFGGGGGGVFGFGVEVEPDIYGIYDVTLDLSDGSSLTQAV
jgi:hypothetical protein